MNAPQSIPPAPAREDLGELAEAARASCGEPLTKRREANEIGIEHGAHHDRRDDGELAWIGEDGLYHRVRDSSTEGPQIDLSFVRVAHFLIGPAGCPGNAAAAT